MAYNLHIFGDSFAVSKHEIERNNWVHQIASHYNAQVVCHAENGANLFHTMYQYHFARNMAKQLFDNDICIVVLTGACRSPIPTCTQTWVDWYEKFIKSEVNIEMNYAWTEAVIWPFVRSLANTNTIVISAFHDFKRDESIDYWMTGDSLVTIAHNEMICDPKTFHWGRETRRNHLSPENHDILAQKIINFIDNPSPETRTIDASDFVKRCYLKL